MSTLLSRVTFSKTNESRLLLCVWYVSIHRYIWVVITRQEDLLKSRSKKEEGNYNLIHGMIITASFLDINIMYRLVVWPQENHEQTKNTMTKMSSLFLVCVCQWYFILWMWWWMSYKNDYRMKGLPLISIWFSSMSIIIKKWRKQEDPSKFTSFSQDALHQILVRKWSEVQFIGLNMTEFAKHFLKHDIENHAFLT